MQPPSFARSVFDAHAYRHLVGLSLREGSFAENEEYTLHYNRDYCRSGDVSINSEAKKRYCPLPEMSQKNLPAVLSALEWHVTWGRNLVLGAVKPAEVHCFTMFHPSGFRVNGTNPKMSFRWGSI